MNPAKPFLVIMGGAKVSDKIGVLKALMEKADTILIGGAMANTFFKAQGIPIGKSRVEADKLDLANELVDLAKKRGVKTFCPDRCGGNAGDKTGAAQHSKYPRLISRNDGVADGWQAVDIGTATIALFQEEIAKAKRFYGMDRSAFLRSRISRKALSPSQRRSRNRTQRPSSAAAIPSPP